MFFPSNPGDWHENWNSGLRHRWIHGPDPDGGNRAHVGLSYPTEDLDTLPEFYVSRDTVHSDWIDLPYSIRLLGDAMSEGQRGVAPTKTTSLHLPFRWKRWRKLVWIRCHTSPLTRTKNLFRSSAYKGQDDRVRNVRETTRTLLGREDFRCPTRNRGSVSFEKPSQNRTQVSRGTHSTPICPRFQVLYRR